MNAVILRHHQVSVLLSFSTACHRLKTLNTDAFKHFLPMFSKGARNVAGGHAFLHANDIVHRDLKAGNVLVGNKHYMNKTVNPNEIPELFREAPVVCKLTDFGESPESHSLLLQTTTIIHAATGNVERGTKPHMAPEIVVDTLKLDHASLEDLKAVDVWALGMVYFNIINPDFNFPFEMEFNSKFLLSPMQHQHFLLSYMKTLARLTCMSYFERFSVTVSAIYCFNPKLMLCFERNWVLLYINENENRCV